MSEHALPRRAFIFSTGMLASGIGFAGIGKDGDGVTSATDILAAMTRAYAECETYQDTGVVSTKFLHGAEERLTQIIITFSTAWVRPLRFRFEFNRGVAGRFVAVAEGSSVRTWWDVLPGVKDGGTLELALAGATGISAGAAHTVPALLMPDSIHGASLAHLVELRRLDDARLDDGTDCFRVEGARTIDRDPELRERQRQEVLKITGKDFGTPVSSPAVLWIDQSTLLLRRIDQQRAHTDFRTEATTTYQPRVNAAVSDIQLAFDPPGG